MKVVSFLASHGGSAAKTIIGAAKSGALNVDIGVVITNNRDSSIFEWCVDMVSGYTTSVVERIQMRH